MEIREMKVGDIIPYENNPRFNDGAVDAVANSIKEFGFKVPIVVDKNNVIIAGHTRLLASKKLGLEKVPVIFADDLSEEQVKAFRLADNKVGEIAQWDYAKLNEELKELEGMEIDMSQFGFDVAELDNYEPTDDDFDIDQAVQDIVTPETKPGDIIFLGQHRLMCGDSTSEKDVATLMGDNEADIFFSDPPYNVNVSNSQGMQIENDDLNDADFLNLLDNAFNQASRHLKPGGAYYIWHAHSSDEQFKQALRKNGFLIKQTLIWVKNMFTLGRSDYKWMHEPCLYGWKEGSAHYFCEEYNHPTVIEDKEALEQMTKEQLLKLLEQIKDEMPTSIIRENKPTKNDLHPTMKPVPMCARLIQHSTKPREKVLDLFGGSGSTLIACEQINRKCFMMEYDPKYCDAIIQRWEQLTGQKAIYERECLKI